MAPTKKASQASTSKDAPARNATKSKYSAAKTSANVSDAVPSKRSARTTEKTNSADSKTAVHPTEGEIDAKGAVRAVKATGKAKRARAAKPVIDVNALPHGLDVKATLVDSAVKDETVAEDAPPSKRKSTRKSAPKDELTGAVKDKSGEVAPKEKASRKPASKKKSEDAKEEGAPPAKKFKGRKGMAVKAVKDEEGDQQSASATDDGKSPKNKKVRKPAKPKTAEQYGVKLGVTPYPELLHPTPEECQKVNDLLSAKHGRVIAPQAPPVPSRTVAGCGEVKCVLEALIRTYMSSHTSMSNANMAIQGLLKRFSTIKEGVGAGSVDWNEVRLAPQEELEQAIRRGGMATMKSKSIKALLDQVHEENQAMRLEIRQKRAAGSDAPTVEMQKEPLPGDERGAAAMARLADEILTSSPDALTLDYLHALGAEEAFMRLLPYPGIGVKTAACTLLFCMQRPCFAVDTHVWRLCKWLGWVPAAADRDQTFAHCDVRVPDGLKYSLHQLLIAHGKTCDRCRAVTGEKSEGWDEAECVLEELVRRTGKKKGGEDPAPKKRKRGSKGSVDDEEDAHIEDAEEEDEARVRDVEDYEEPVTTKVKPKAKSQIKTKPKAKAEPKVKAEPKAKVESKAKVETKAKAEPKKSASTRKSATDDTAGTKASRVKKSTPASATAQARPARTNATRTTKAKATALPIEATA